MDEYFICETCGTRKHITALKKRETMPGDYCNACADEEKCAACGEMYAPEHLVFKPDIKNYVCHSCLPDYCEVAAYIKPLGPVVEHTRKAA